MLIVWPHYWPHSSVSRHRCRTHFVRSSAGARANAADTSLGVASTSAYMLCRASLTERWCLSSSAAAAATDRPTTHDNVNICCRGSRRSTSSSSSRSSINSSGKPSVGGRLDHRRRCRRRNVLSLVYDCLELLMVDCDDVQWKLPSVRRKDEVITVHLCSVRINKNYDCDFSESLW